jgi:hypothetical protein
MRLNLYSDVEIIFDRAGALLPATDGIKTRLDKE